MTPHARRSPDRRKIELHALREERSALDPLQLAARRACSPRTRVAHRCQNRVTSPRRQSSGKGHDDVERRSHDDTRIAPLHPGDRVLARDTFAPGHACGTAFPGTRGNSVIAGHRDTHLAFLRDLARGDTLVIERSDGARVEYVVDGATRVRETETAVMLPCDATRLTLVTCWPFDALRAGGPWRWVVTATARDVMALKAPAGIPERLPDRRRWRPLAAVPASGRARRRRSPTGRRRRDRPPSLR